MSTSEGLSKAIDELGLTIIAKDIELEMQKKEIETMRTKIKHIEQYIEMYEEFFNYDKYIKNKKGAE